ncbi:type II toxin-antitoxin system HicB family antitoxin [Castellaniella caeni]|uniref:type II toxin-antitoxin system HicB family antitoxin n=1 Tax=Castellaniella caeni TaxID=266123 RepID=UPI0008356767|nr:type II toxin-antitoxin system HicB family antitoxin [Castellaniella caeni]
MSNALEYKGYLGAVEFSVEDQCLCGKVEFINDLVLFDGQSVTEVRQAFEIAVDHYLRSCQQRGVLPDQPFKGSFNVRVGGDLHQKAAYEARRRGVALNEFVIQALKNELRSGQAA